MSLADAVPSLAGKPPQLHDGMLFVRGGTFRIGSDKHYPEEAPVHRVTLDGFWINRTPVTNRQFQHSTLFLSPPRVGSHRVAESVARPP
jgi:formylglycine-generating enzyme required for sulfatase activity